MNVDLLKLFLLQQKLDPAVVTAIGAGAQTIVDAAERISHASYAKALADLTTAAVNCEKLAGVLAEVGAVQDAADLRLFRTKILSDVADMLGDDEEDDAEEETPPASA